MNSGVAYLIAGDGMIWDGEMGDMVRKRGLENSARLLGVQNNVGALLACADAFLLPSNVEGFPNAIMEAMMSGIPVVASNVGGTPDLVRNGIDEFLHDPKDIDGIQKPGYAFE